MEFVDYVDQIVIEIIQNKSDAPPAEKIWRSLSAIKENDKNLLRSYDFIISITYLVFVIF